MSPGSMEHSVAEPDLEAVPAKSAGHIAGFLSSCAAIGAICESSPWLARRMVEAVNGTTLPVVELGAGYGSMTRLLPDTTVSVERDSRRYKYLRDRFPTRTTINGCAVEFLGALTRAAVVVSSIPSVNNPEFGELRASVEAAMRAGTVTKLVTYTYFPINPFAGIFPKSEMVGYEVLNLPPAFLWSYSC